MAIDFTLSPELEEVRNNVRDFIERVVKPGEETIEGSNGTEPLNPNDRIS